MPKVRKVLGACTVEVAQRCRTCYRDRNNHSILKGTLCLVIKDPGGGAKNYCPTCALAILDQAADDLQTLRARLS
ncbi:MAG: hypothetical protein ACRDPY_17940 [Streptosporangiaceae bacterium]